MDMYMSRNESCYRPLIYDHASIRQLALAVVARMPQSDGGEGLGEDSRGHVEGLNEDTGRQGEELNEELYVDTRMYAEHTSVRDEDIRTHTEDARAHNEGVQVFCHETMPCEPGPSRSKDYTDRSASGDDDDDDDDSDATTTTTTTTTTTSTTTTAESSSPPRSSSSSSSGTLTSWYLSPCPTSRVPSHILASHPRSRSLQHWVTIKGLDAATRTPWQTSPLAWADPEYPEIVHTTSGRTYTLQGPMNTAATRWSDVTAQAFAHGGGGDVGLPSHWVDLVIDDLLARRGHAIQGNPGVVKVEEDDQDDGQRLASSPPSSSSLPPLPPPPPASTPRTVRGFKRVRQRTTSSIGSAGGMSPPRTPRKRQRSTATMSTTPSSSRSVSTSLSSTTPQTPRTPRTPRTPAYSSSSPPSLPRELRLLSASRFGHIKVVRAAMLSSGEADDPDEDANHGSDGPLHHHQMSRFPCTPTPRRSSRTRKAVEPYWLIKDDGRGADTGDEEMLFASRRVMCADL